MIFSLCEERIRVDLNPEEISPFGIFTLQIFFCPLGSFPPLEVSSSDEDKVL